MIYSLIDPNSPILKAPLSEVSFENFKEIFHLTPQEVYDNLLETMGHYGGIGLSANQCGLMIRAFVLYTDWYKKEHQIFFNPKIIWESEETEMLDEGCLTYPNLFLTIKRPSVIEFTYQDVTGEEKKGKFAGMTARVFQHEYDHMEGKNFTQRVSKLRLDIGRRKAKKVMRKKKNA